MVCPKFNSHVYKTEKVGYKGNTFVSILQLGVQRGFSIWSVQCSKKNDDGPNEYGFFKKINKMHPMNQLI
jgi:hypothetical protein